MSHQLTKDCAIYSSAKRRSRQMEMFYYSPSAQYPLLESTLLDPGVCTLLHPNHEESVDTKRLAPGDSCPTFLILSYSSHNESSSRMPAECMSGFTRTGLSQLALGKQNMASDLRKAVGSFLLPSQFPPCPKFLLT